MAVSKAKVEYGSMSYGLRERERGISCVWVASRGGGGPEKRTPETVEGLGGRFSFRPDLLNKNLIVINIKRK